MTLNYKPQILLIEDDMFIAEIYTIEFRQGGYDVNIAQDGKKGLSMVKQLHPAVVLLDIILPKMSGWDVLKVMKSDEELKHIPVVLMTNLGQQDEVERGRTLGADAYLIKAYIGPRELLAEVEKILKKEK